MPDIHITPLAQAFAIIGTIGSQIMNLSALSSIREIHAAKSTLLYPAFPFVIASLTSISGLIYAILVGHVVVAISTSITFSFNVSYLCVHLRHSPDRRSILLQLVKYFLIIATVETLVPLIACSIRPDSCNRFTAEWMGLCNAVLYSILYCGQLVKMKEILRTKNAASISPPLTAGVCLCTSIWLMYSCIAGDYYYIASGAIGLCGALTQVVLLLKYPRNQVKPLNDEDKPSNNTETL
jgi:uncharacterized protein with PQ loop repeat